VDANYDKNTDGGEVEGDDTKEMSSANGHGIVAEVSAGRSDCIDNSYIPFSNSIYVRRSIPSRVPIMTTSKLVNRKSHQPSEGSQGRARITVCTLLCCCCLILIVYDVKFVVVVFYKDNDDGSIKNGKLCDGSSLLDDNHQTRIWDFYPLLSPYSSAFVLWLEYHASLHLLN
jgi:hypothetical protein